jgi:hypothetical protein
MSVAIESQGDLPLPDNLQHAEDAQSDLGDGSSSLSDIEQDVDQDDGQDGLDDDMESDEASEEEEDEEEEENDSEAETERLDVSPDKKRTHKDVVLNSHTESHTFERAPSNLHGQYGAEEDEEEESDEEDNPPGDISDDELSLPDSPKTAAEEEAVADAADDAAAATAQLEVYSAAERYHARIRSHKQEEEAVAIAGRRLSRCDRQRRTSQETHWIRATT